MKLESQKENRASSLAQEKGIDGEIRVALEIASLDNSAYNAFHNITVEDGIGTTQVDHVIISRFGIFVVETKNYSGWIFGTEKERQWTCTYPTGEQHTFQNPIKQNERHIHALSSLLCLDMSLFYPLIAFCGNAEFKKTMPSTVMTSGYAAYIQGKTAQLINAQEVQCLVEKLTKIMLPRGEETNRKHRESIYQRHENKRTNIERSDDYSRLFPPIHSRNRKLWNFASAKSVLAKQKKPSFAKALLVATTIVFIFLVISRPSRQLSIPQPTAQSTPSSANPFKPETPVAYSPPATSAWQPTLNQENRLEDSQPGSYFEQKEKAWQHWYKKPPECESLTNANLVDCGNQYVAAKKYFERLYTAGKIR